VVLFGDFNLFLASKYGDLCASIGIGRAIAKFFKV